jgi:hypothetical protein
MHEKKRNEKKTQKIFNKNVYIFHLIKKKLKSIVLNKFFSSSGDF